MDSQFGCNAVLSRDCDCRLSNKEAMAVHRWITTHPTKFLAFRGHPHHYSADVPILGGLWGCKGSPFEGLEMNMQRMSSGHEAGTSYNLDQQFISTCLYTKIKESLFRKDESETNFYIGQPHTAEGVPMAWKPPVWSKS